MLDGGGNTYKSTDTTSYWVQTSTNLSYPRILTWVDVCRDALGSLYALAKTGEIYRSRDNGVTWELRGDVGTLSTYDGIIADTTTASVLYVLNSAVGSTADNVVFRSTDGGLTWTPKSGLIKDTYVGIAISMGKLYVIDDDGETRRTSLDLLENWVTMTDVGSATDYTHLARDMRGYLYVLRTWGTPVSKSVNGGDTWVELSNNPSADAKRLYTCLTQNQDTTDIYSGNLYILRSDGTGVYSLDDGATAWKTDWIDIGVRTDYRGLCSCDMIFPQFVDNQPGDDIWRSSNIATYNVDFYDTNYGRLRRFETRVTNAPAGAGSELDPWRTVLDEINTSSYTVNWQLLSATWLNLRESVTNYVYVRVTDNASNVTTSTDYVFYVKKDTTSPTVPVLLLPSNNLTTNYLTISFDWADSTDTASGIANYELRVSTDVNFSVVTFSSSPVYSQAVSTPLPDGLYYWKVQAKDKAGNYSSWTSTWSFTLDSTAPGAITNLTADRVNCLEGQIHLTWTAPGDDGYQGQLISGSRFHIATTTVLTEAQTTSYWVGKRDTAEIQISTSGIAPGTLLTYQLINLSPGTTYYFRIWTRDEALNWSGMSNGATTYAQPPIPDTTPPAPVTDLSAQTGTAEKTINLSWTYTGDDGSAGAIIDGRYAIQYTSDSVLAGTTEFWKRENAQIDLSTSVSQGASGGYTVANLIEGGTYYFRIWLRDEIFTNWSSTSNIASASSKRVAPENVTLFISSAQPQGNTIKLTWSTTSITASDFQGVRICYSTESFTVITTTVNPVDIAKSTTSCLYTNLTDDLTYYYKAFSYDDAITPNYSTGTMTSTYPRDKTPPAAVTNLSAQTGTLQKTIDLTWTAPGDNGWSGNLTGKFRIKHSTTSTYSWQDPPLTDYNIEISTNNQLPITNYQYTVTGLIEGATYFFRLWTADEASNWSGISNGATNYSKRELPTSVTSFAAVPIATGNQIDLSWGYSPSSDWIGTMIRYKTSPPAPTSPTDGDLLISSPSAISTYQHINLTDNLTYYYTAFAYDDAITPNYATGVSTSTYPGDTVAPSNVSNFTASGGDMYVSLSWINVYGDQIGTRICSTITAELLTTPTDFVLVDISTPGNNYTHTNLVNGVTYYYKAFAYDEVPNFATGTTAYAIPTAVADTLYVSSFAVTGVNVLQGGTTNVAYVLNFTVNANTVTITGITVRQIGDSQDSDVSKVRLINDVDLSSSVTGGDVLLSTTSFVGGIATFLLNYDVSISSARQILIAFDVSTQAVHGRKVQTRLANQGDITVQSPDVVNLFSDYNSNPFTIVDVSSPSNVSNFKAIAVSSGNQIDLSWQNPTDIDYAGLMIRYKTISPAPANISEGTLLISSPSTVSSYQHINLQDKVTYYYTAFARDSVPNYASGVSTFTYPRDTLAPANIALLPVSVADNQITLNWTNPADSDYAGVDIHYSTSITNPTRSDTLLISSPSTVSTYQHINLSNNLTYYYTLFARDEVPNYALGISTSAYPKDTTAPGAVTNLSAQPSTLQKTIDLTWTAPGDNLYSGIIATGTFRIDYATYTKTWIYTSYRVNLSTYNVTPATLHGYTVTSLIEGATYFFRLWTADEAGNWSTISNGATTWAQRQAPENVTLFVSSAQPQGNTIKLTWSTGSITASDFQGVRICSSTAYYPTDPNIGIVADVPKNTTYYLDTGLVDNVTYYYRAWAYDEARNYAVEVATTSNYPSDIIRPGMVLDLSPGTVTGTSIELRWTSPGDNGTTGDIVNGSYWIKYSSKEAITPSNWDTPPTPTYETFIPTTTPANAAQSKTISDLQSDTTYYFALKTRDEAYNWSYVSNCATGTTRDITAPGKITDLVAQPGATPGSVSLSWTAPGDDGYSGKANSYDIRYSLTPITNEAQFDAAYTVAGEPSPQSAGATENFTVENLTPGGTHYFCMKTADEVPIWSELSIGATSYAKPAPPAGLTLYFSTTTTDAPFTADYSDKLSTTSGVTSDITTFVNSRRGVNYFQFYPRATNTSTVGETTFPSGITQRGWLYQVPLSYKTQSAGYWNINLGWQCTSTAGRGKLNYRISKVSATVTGTIELREKLLDWYQDEYVLTPTAGGVTYYRNFWTPTVSPTTFLPGEYLMVEFYINVSVGAGSGAGEGWKLEVNTGNNYIVTTDIKDVTPPGTITDLYAVPASTDGLVTSTWTAPGNNELLGSATYYDIRYTEDPNYDWETKWGDAKQWPRSSYRPVGGPAGTSETETITGLTPGATCYIRIKTRDESLNWSAPSNTGTARIPIHPVRVVNITPQHGRMNESKRDALLRFSITNDRPSGPGYNPIGLSQLRIKLTKDGLTPLTTAQARALFSNFYLYLATTTRYHYDVDLSTVAKLSNAEIILDAEGMQIIYTSTVPERAISPGTKKEYYLVADLAVGASTQPVNTFYITVVGLDKIICWDEVTKTNVPLKAEAGIPITSSPQITVIKPPTPPAGWPKRIGPLRSVNSKPMGGPDTGNVYIGADDGKLYTYDSSGNEKWVSTTGNKIRSSVRATTEGGENYVYFCNDAGYIYKLKDNISGYEQKWSTNPAVPDKPLSDASVAVCVDLPPGSRNLYICATDQKVYKVDGSNGGKQWSTAVLDGPLSPFVLVDQFTGGVNSLWVGTDKSLYHLSTGDGSIQKQLNIGLRFRNDPGLDSGWIVRPNLNYLFAPCDNGKIYCRQSTKLDTIPDGWKGRNGQTDGEFNAGSPITTMVAGPTPEGTPEVKYLYFGTEDGKLYKIRADNGTLVWTYQAGGKISSTPLPPYLTDGIYVYFGCDDGYFYAIHKDTREMRAGFPIRTGAEITESPFFVNGNMHILSADGVMYAITP